MRRAGTERRNLFFLLLMVAGLAGLVWLAMKQGDIRIMPPESPAAAAKRKSPDNAYYMFRSARAYMEKLDVPAPADDGVPRPPQRRTMTRDTLQALLEANDPRLAGYLESARPVVSKIRGAFAKPYYLCPEIGAVRASNIEETVDFRDLGYLLAVYALYGEAATAPDAAVFEYVLDGVRMGRMLSSDGPLACYYFGESVQRYALDALSVLASRATSAEVLRGVLDALTPLAAAPVSVRESLEFHWRMMDNSLSKGPREAQPKRKRARRPDQYLRDYRFAWEVKRGQWFLIKHRDEYRQVLTLPYPEYRQWTFTRPEMAKARHPYTDTPDEMDRLMLLHATGDARMRGARIVLALELYRLAKGAYPDALEALAPDYLPEVPLDPFAERPFIYLVKNGDCWLYSLGENGRDDGGDANGADIVIYMPAWVQARCATPTAG